MHLSKETTLQNALLYNKIFYKENKIIKWCLKNKRKSTLLFALQFVKCFFFFFCRNIDLWYNKSK